MKKNIFLLIVLFLTVNLYSQNNKVQFVFASKEDISKNFENRTDNKRVEFKIKGIENSEDLNTLKDKIKAYRGVLAFKILGQDTEGLYNAKLNLYQYADHWMYYKFLFLRNDVNKIIIDGKKYKSEEVSDF